MTTLHIIKLSENAPAMAHGFRVYPDGKITKATEQEGELAGKWLEREKGKR